MIHVGLRLVEHEDEVAVRIADLVHRLARVLGDQFVEQLAVAEDLPAQVSMSTA